MAQHYFDSQSVTTTGVKPPATLTKWPEFGGTAQAVVSAGGTATVALRAWNDSSAKETLAQIVLPVPSGTKTGDLYDSVVVASQWENWDWNVIALSAGATLKLNLSGSGI